MMRMMSGKQAVFEMLKVEGVEYIFGNPGTSEGPLIDIIGDYPDMKYIMTLQESVAVGMAESYARATKTTSFVSLHVDSGLANGIALMLDAYNTGTPMVVTSANYDARKINESKTDLAELVRPVTKWAVELSLPDQIPSVLRRAFNEANSHPKGPVYVGFTSNALEGTAKMNIVPSSVIHTDVRPEHSGIERAADVLLEARRPVLMVGDRASDDNANEQAVRLAEMLGMPVYQSRGAEVAFPSTHPQYLGIHSLRSAESRQALKGFDVILAVGMDPFEELFYWGDTILDDTQILIHIDPVPGKVGKTEPTDIGIIASCRSALDELGESVRNRVEQKEISRRKARVVNHVLQTRRSCEDSTMHRWNDIPITPARMMFELAKAVPKNAIIIDDAVSNRDALRQYFHADKRDDIRGVRGQSIGGGIGATMGTQCAVPDRPVFGIIGDGSAMMTIQGLWTAANENIPCIFVICNNGMYRVLKVNFGVYQRDILGMSELAGKNLRYSDFPTPFDISTIARGMGINGERITEPTEIGPAVKRALATGKPSLIDVVIDGSL